MSAASLFKKSSSYLICTPFLLIDALVFLIIPCASNAFSILFFSIAQEYIFQKSSSAVYKSCAVDLSFDKGLEVSKLGIT